MGNNGKLGNTTYDKPGMAFSVICQKQNPDPGFITPWGIT
jgi:hypothetical protein